MKHNNFLNNFFIALYSIKKYGVGVFIKCIFYEVYYSFKYLDNAFFDFDQTENPEASHEASWTSSNYSTPNIPTPYYFLSKIAKVLKEEKIDNFNLIDLGCGSGRLVKYFDTKFSINFVGFDISKKIINKNLNKFKKKNLFFFCQDLKEIRQPDQLSIFFNRLDKKNFLVFISDSFDSQSILNLIKIFKLKLGEFFFVMVNQKNLEEFDKFNPFKKIIFADKKRNISFYKI